MWLINNCQLTVHLIRSIQHSLIPSLYRVRGCFCVFAAIRNQVARLYMHIYIIRACRAGQWGKSEMRGQKQSDTKTIGARGFLTVTGSSPAPYEPIVIDEIAEPLRERGVERTCRLHVGTFHARRSNKEAYYPPMSQKNAAQKYPRYLQIVAGKKPIDKNRMFPALILLLYY